MPCSEWNRPVPKWLRRLGRRPLAGGPATRRQKTYPAQTGYVYEYVYEGHRPRGLLRRTGVEYVFSVSAAGRRGLPVSVLLTNKVVRLWERAHGRALTATEQYAVAKMSLFEAFDQRPAPEALRGPIRVRAPELEAILGRLGLD